MPGQQFRVNVPPPPRSTPGFQAPSYPTSPGYPTPGMQPPAPQANPQQQQQIMQQQQQISSLEAQLREARSKQEAAETNLMSERSVTGQKDRELGTLKQQVQNFQQQLQQKDTEIQKLKFDLTEAKTSLATAQQAQSQQTVRVSTMESELENVKRQLDNALNQVRYEPPFCLHPRRPRPPLAYSRSQSRTHPPSLPRIPDNHPRSPRSSL